MVMSVSRTLTRSLLNALVLLEILHAASAFTQRMG